MKFDGLASISVLIPSSITKTRDQESIVKNTVHVVIIGSFPSYEIPSSARESIRQIGLLHG